MNLYTKIIFVRYSEAETFSIAHIPVPEIGEEDVLVSISPFLAFVSKGKKEG
jgi:hypothetical protein